MIMINHSGHTCSFRAIVDRRVHTIASIEQAKITRVTDISMTEKKVTDILDSLVAVLQSRKSDPGEKSYASSLFQQGETKICEKISEEAQELVESAFETGDEAGQHLIHEAADLLFHVMVLLVHKGFTLSEVRSELSRRFGTSGLEEKANRNKK